MTRLVGAAVHTGTGVFDAAAVTVEDGRITAVETTWTPRQGDVDLSGYVLAPGFVDLMVNGGGGVLVNEAPERLEEIAAVHRALGTTSFLANVVTDHVDAMRRVRRAVEKHTDSGVVGVHWEGPVLALSRRGMHDLDRLSREFPLELARPREGLVTLVTLAPEVAGPETVRQLVDAGARVSLGHSEASLEEFRMAVDAGATLVTHLFNGMPPLTGRAPGIVGGALVDDRVAAGVINDGLHVDFASVRLAWRAKPAGGCFFVTDAMSPVGSPQTEFTLAGTHVRVENGQLLTDEGRLGGSVLTMGEAVRNAVTKVGIPFAEAIRMASTYPARHLGLEGRIGVIAPGARADLVVLDAALKVERVMFRGAWV